MRFLWFWIAPFTFVCQTPTPIPHIQPIDSSLYILCIPVFYILYSEFRIPLPYKCADVLSLFRWWSVIPFKPMSFGLVQFINSVGSPSPSWSLCSITHKWFNFICGHTCKTTLEPSYPFYLNLTMHTMDHIECNTIMTDTRTEKLHPTLTLI